MEVIFALVLMIVVCFVVPIVTAIILLKNEEVNKPKGLVYILFGALIYGILQYFMKQKGLTFLIVKTGFVNIYQSHYILYLFLVSLIGVLFMTVPSLLVFKMMSKNKMVLKEIMLYAIGYCACEAILIEGISAIVTLVDFKNQKEELLDGAILELYLSVYERLIIMIIQLAILVVFAYFVEKKWSGIGFAISALCELILLFVPGFIMAFTTQAFLELYSKNVAFIMIYTVLTVAMIASVLVMFSLRYKIGKK